MSPSKRSSSPTVKHKTETYHRNQDIKMSPETDLESLSSSIVDGTANHNLRETVSVMESLERVLKEPARTMQLNYGSARISCSVQLV
jgi:hypothetical protein